MLTYLLGPSLSLLPKNWREALPFSKAIQWPAAAAASGFLQMCISIIALARWYWYSMNTWINRALDAALTGKIMATDHDIGITGLILWATHPLTWALGYCALEGAVRLCAGAFSNTALATFPLFLLGKIAGSPTGSRRREGDVSGSSGGSLGSALRDRLWAATLRPVPDKLTFHKNAEEEEFLEIRASHRKEDWNPPRVVRYDDVYYRLEACSQAGPPRPFRYVLRRLPAGVPGRTVLLYAPEDAVIS